MLSAAKFSISRNRGNNILYLKRHSKLPNLEIHEEFQSLFCILSIVFLSLWGKPVTGLGGWSGLDTVYPPMRKVVLGTMKTVGVPSELNLTSQNKSSAWGNFYHAINPGSTGAMLNQHGIRPPSRVCSHLSYAV